MSSFRPRLSLFCTLSMVGMLALGGCKTLGDETGSVDSEQPSQRVVQEMNVKGMSKQNLRVATEAWGKKYEANDSDAEAALNYALGLRAMDQRAQALAVLQTASIKNPENMQILAAYGKVLGDVGRYREALDVLSRAHRPDRPDWRILSTQGAVLDQMAEHEEARKHYDAALKIVPDEPSVLSNLGLSYALSKNLTQAEQILRRAAALPQADERVRQNLVIVLGMQGRFAEAEQVAQQDLSPEQARENIASLRKMVSQNNSWKTLQNGVASDETAAISPQLKAGGRKTIKLPPPEQQNVLPY
jgi:Flp pilus assembly protein TadD